MVEYSSLNLLTDVEKLVDMRTYLLAGGVTSPHPSLSMLPWTFSLDMRSAGNELDGKEVYYIPLVLQTNIAKSNLEFKID